MKLCDERLYCTSLITPTRFFTLRKFVLLDEIDCIFSFNTVLKNNTVFNTEHKNPSV